MKIHYAVFLILLFHVLSPGARAQTTVVGGGLLYHQPVGSLADRYLGAPGVMVFAGRSAGNGWTWVGRIDHIELSRLNTETLVKRVLVEAEGRRQEFTLPLQRLAMKLKATGLMVEARYAFLETGLLESHLNVGFGFSYWENSRNAYRDSLFADTSRAHTGTPSLVLAVSVPEIRQSDWSGTVSLGVEAGIRIGAPITLTVGADYKMIIGELWQTLALDMESVSTMRFVTIRAGVQVGL